MYNSTIKTVVIHMGSGNLYHQGFPRITVELRTQDNKNSEKITGSLPPESNLFELYKKWQRFYKLICERKPFRSHIDEIDDDNDFEIDESGVTNVSEIDFDESSQFLKITINNWLKSPQFLNIDRKLRRGLNQEDEIRVILETSDEILRGLPWNCWDFFEDYPQAEMILASPEYQSPPNLQIQRNREKVRILAIIGSNSGIDFDHEIKLLKNLEDAEIIVINQASREELNNHLWSELGWDMIFFAGHSNTENQTGRIYINENKTGNSLTIEQLKEAFKEAINNGLKLAIFNSCQGLGLANSLEQLYIPTVIVMREPVPNLVAQSFFKTFLEKFAIEKLSLNLSVQKARRKLHGLKNQFPGASWLPVICQNPAVEFFTWRQLGGVLRCPYRGLSSFREEDADFFFGREEFCDRLVNSLKRKSLVTVVGASGTGKSSVVFAGMVPQLRQDTTQNWQIISFRPGKNPFEALAIALTPYQNLRENKPSLLGELELETKLTDSSRGLSQILEQIITQESNLFPLVLIIDQFEELYTLTPESQRQPFLDTLLQACDFVPGLKLVITLRADFYGHALSYRPFSDALEGNVLHNPPMSKPELLSTIEKPAIKMQIRFESGLVNKLIDDVWGESGRLPLLEFALTQLWSKIDNDLLSHQAYEKIGGVDLALANYAEEVFARLSLADRERTQKIFMQLVRLGEETEVTRRLATFNEIKSENWDLVTRLANERLLVTNYNEIRGVQTVEIIHEALISNWGRLQIWMQIDGDFRRWQERLRSTIFEWESNNCNQEWLLRGASLVVAEDWLLNRSQELNQREIDFIHQSLEFRESEIKKNKRRKGFTILGLSVSSFLALGLAGATLLQNWKDIQTVAESSNALFVSNNRLDALKKAIKARRRIQTLPWVDNFIQNQVKSVLGKSIFQIMEFNRLQHQDDVTSIDYSADGKTLATGNKSGQILIWNYLDGSVKPIDAHDNQSVIELTFNHKYGVFGSASNDGLIQFRNSDGNLINQFQADVEGMNFVTFSRNNNFIALVGSDKKIQLWKCNVQSWKCKKELVNFEITQKNVNDNIHSIVFNSNSELIASGYRDGTIRIWDKTGKLLQEINKEAQTKHNDNNNYTYAIRSLVFSPDNKYIASASTEGKIKIWHLNGELFQELKDNGNNSHSQRITKLVFSSDGKYIASASKDNTVKVWDLTGNLLKTFKGHTENIWAIAFNPNHNHIIASGANDRTVRLWKHQNTPITSYKVHYDIVKALSFSPNGQLIASASYDRAIKLCKKDGSLCKTVGIHNSRVNDVAFSSDGKVIISGSDDGTVKLWKCNTQNLSCDHNLFPTITLPDINNRNNDINGIALSPNNQLIATANTDTKVRIWQCKLQTWQCNHQQPVELNGHQKPVKDVEFSPDGKYIASAGRDNNIIIWKRQGDSWKNSITLENHQDEVNKVVFSPDGKFIASASRDKTIILWKYEGNSWKYWKSLDNHQYAVQDLTFIKNGRLIISVSEDRKIRIWNRNGDLLDTIEAHEDQAFAVAFNPMDNNIIASAGRGKKIIVWNLDTILDIDKLTHLGCSWLDNYFKTNQDNDYLCNQ